MEKAELYIPIALAIRDLRSCAILCSAERLFLTDVSGKSVGLTWIALPFKMEPICCSETFVRNCHSTLRKAPQERGYHSQRAGGPNHAKCEIRKLFKQPSYLPGDKLLTPLAAENRLE